MHAVVTHEWADKIRVEYYFNDKEYYYDKYVASLPKYPIPKQDIVSLSNVYGMLDQEKLRKYVFLHMGWSEIPMPFDVNYMTNPLSIEDLDNSILKRFSVLKGVVESSIKENKNSVRLSNELKGITIIEPRYKDTGTKLDSYVGVEVSYA